MPSAQPVHRATAESLEPRLCLAVGLFGLRLSRCHCRRHAAGDGAFPGRSARVRRRRRRRAVPAGRGVRIERGERKLRVPRFGERHVLGRPNRAGRLEDDPHAGVRERPDRQGGRRGSLTQNFGSVLDRSTPPLDPSAGAAGVVSVPIVGPPAIALAPVVLRRRTGTSWSSLPSHRASTSQPATRRTRRSRGPNSDSSRARSFPQLALSMLRFQSILHMQQNVEQLGFVKR
jgi:hypothetical protein